MRVCQRMNNYKIDKSKNIGNVIFVVEGVRPDTGGTELSLDYSRHSRESG